MRKTMPVARRALSDEHDLTLNLRKVYAQCLYQDPSASRDDVAEAVAIYEDVLRRARAYSGPGHPNWWHPSANPETARAQARQLRP